MPKYLMSCTNNDLAPNEKEVYSLAAAKRIQVNHPEESGKDNCEVTWVKIRTNSIRSFFKEIVHPLGKLLGIKTV